MNSSLSPHGHLMAALKTHFDMLLLLENMKPIKTKTKNTKKLFRIMDMEITEQQFKQAQAWYQGAKKDTAINTHKSG
jgi:hypothetical protein